MSESTERDDRSVSGSPGEVLQQEGPRRYTVLTVAAYAAFAIGVAVTALLHDGLSPGGQALTNPGVQWTSSLVTQTILIGAGIGFFTGRRLDGTGAYLAILVGSAIGYWVAYLIADGTNEVLLGLTTTRIEIGMHVGIAVGVGVTGALLAWVADSYEDWT